MLNYLDLDAKSYTGCIRLGQATTTDDAEGELVSATPAAQVTEARIRAAMRQFTGEIRQRPASVSAIKVGGERAYKRVRAGETVELAARPVTVSRFDAESFTVTGDFVDIVVEVDCSSGTYIRALARDLGEALGVGGHLIQLRRTRVGRFGIEQALTLEQLAESDEPVVLSMADAVRASMPVREITPDEVTELAFGRSLSIPDPNRSPRRSDRTVPSWAYFAMMASGPVPFLCSRLVSLPTVQRWRGLDSVPRDWGRCVVTIGVFDGVHRGHAHIIGEAVKIGAAAGMPTVLITFDPPPAEVVRPGSHPPN